MAQVHSVRKSKNFSLDKPFAVAVFVKGNGNKFATGAFGSNQPYSLTFDLKAIYATECNTANGFDAEKAFKLFEEEYKGDQEGVNLYDFPVGDLCEHASVWVPSRTGGYNEMRVLRVASYADHETAERTAKAGIENQLAKQTVYPEKPQV